MSRSERLLDLLQILRARRYSITGAALARELEVSLRTVYRDISALQAQGAVIQGEAGVGYMLKPGFMLPPLMFTSEEIEALVLGASWVVNRADSGLAKAARNVLSKIKEVLPSPLRRELEATTLIVAPAGESATVPDETAILLRRAIREQRKVAMHYRDVEGRASQRVIWPFGMGYMENVLMVMAWCELRKDLRNFRADRIQTIELRGDRYPESRATLLGQWRKREGLRADDIEM